MALLQTQSLNCIFNYNAISNHSSFHTFHPDNTNENSSESLLGLSPAMNQRETGAASNSDNKKKRKKRVRTYKGTHEIESQRMTHITIERNRRRQMKNRIAVLRSLMSDAYVQKGDQASIIGGAIEFVKELEQQAQYLESQKPQVQEAPKERVMIPFTIKQEEEEERVCEYSKYTSKNTQVTADVEVTLIETHANIRILTHRSSRKLSKMVAGFHMLHLPILHLNVTTFGSLVIYSVNAKVEEKCEVKTVDEISAVVQHILAIIEEMDMQQVYINQQFLDSPLELS